MEEKGFHQPLTFLYPLQKMEIYSNTKFERKKPLTSYLCRGFRGLRESRGKKAIRSKASSVFK